MMEKLALLVSGKGVHAPRTPTPFTLFTTTYNVHSSWEDRFINSLYFMSTLYIYSATLGLHHRVGRVLSFFPVDGIGTPPTPYRQASVPPSLWFRGEGHTHWWEGGGIVPNSDEGTYTVVLCKYMYFVACAFGLWRKWKMKSWKCDQDDPILSKWLREDSTLFPLLKGIYKLCRRKSFTPPKSQPLDYFYWKSWKFD